MMAAKGGDAPGRPQRAALPSWAEPQLATLTHDRFSDAAWVFERKLDGERCLAFVGSAGGRLMSRSGHEITANLDPWASARRSWAGRR